MRHRAVHAPHQDEEVRLAKRRGRKTALTELTPQARSLRHKKRECASSREGEDAERASSRRTASWWFHRQTDKPRPALLDLIQAGNPPMNQSRS